jgi:small conductance mechanosensitive channel
MNMLLGVLAGSGISGLLESAGLDGIWPVVIDYAARIVLVIIGFFVFKLIIKLMLKAIKKRLDKKPVQSAFQSFTLSIVKAAMWIIVMLLFLQVLKVPLSPVVAAIGTLGLGVGLALKDHMANIAGGVMIGVNNLFSVGDYIKCAGTEGVVDKVELFSTRLRTVDNKLAFVPNATFSSNSVFNYTKENLRRVDISIGISYNAQIDEVKQVLLDMMAANELIKTEPAAFAGVTDFGDSSVNLTVRAWTETSNYWDVYFYLNETLKKEFDARNIEIPFPQLDVHTV